MRPFLAVLSVLATASICASSAVASPVALPGGGRLTDMRVATDGSVHVAIEPSTAPTKSASLVGLDSFGALLAASNVVFPTRFSGRISALTPNGGLVAADWRRVHGAGQTRLVEAGPDGAVSKPAAISVLGRAALPGQLLVGPTGTLVVYSDETSSGGSNPIIAVRPAGSKIFAPAVRVGPRETPHRRKTNGGSFTAIALGPDGGGALIFQADHSPVPLPVLRRIAPNGSLGPPISVPIGSSLSDDPMLAIGPQGTILAGFYVAPKASGPGALVSDLKITTLPPGAAAITPIQDLGADRSIGLGETNVGIAIGPGDQAAAIAGTDAHGLRIFAGPASALQPLQVVPATEPDFASLVFGADGGLTALWGGYAKQGMTGGITAAHRPPGGAFGPAHVVATAQTAETVTRPEHVVALADGTLELGYASDLSISETADFLVRFQP